MQELYGVLEAEESELNKLLDMETAGSIVRSRIKWAEYGERSSKYFCNLEKRSYEKKNIRQLKTDSGQIVVDPKKVLHEIFTFYKNLYSSEVSLEDMEYVNEFVAPLDIPVLVEESVLNLNTPITKNELWNALKMMGLEKVRDLMVFLVCFI